MMVQYAGNDKYLIHIGFKTYELNKSEIDEIQKFNFETMKICKSTEEILEDLENLEDKNLNLSEKISDLENEIEWLKDENAELKKQIPE